MLGEQGSVYSEVVGCGWYGYYFGSRCRWRWVWLARGEVAGVVKMWLVRVVGVVNEGREM